MESEQGLLELNVYVHIYFWTGYVQLMAHWQFNG